jgi:hypothetical protein
MPQLSEMDFKSQKTVLALKINNFNIEGYVRAKKNECKRTSNLFIDYGLVGW